jgi:hypothetical protein
LSGTNSLVIRIGRFKPIFTQKDKRSKAVHFASASQTLKQPGPAARQSSFSSTTASRPAERWRSRRSTCRWIVKNQTAAAILRYPTHITKKGHLVVVGLFSVIESFTG